MRCPPHNPRAPRFIALSLRLFWSASFSLWTRHDPDVQIITASRTELRLNQTTAKCCTLPTPPSAVCFGAFFVKRVLAFTLTSAKVSNLCKSCALKKSERNGKSLLEASWQFKDWCPSVVGVYLEIRISIWWMETWSPLEGQPAPESSGVHVEVLKSHLIGSNSDRFSIRWVTCPALCFCDAVVTISWIRTQQALVRTHNCAEEGAHRSEALLVRVHSCLSSILIPGSHTDIISSRAGDKENPRAAYFLPWYPSGTVAECKSLLASSSVCLNTVHPSKRISERFLLQQHCSWAVRTQSQDSVPWVCDEFSCLHRHQVLWFENVAPHCHLAVGPYKVIWHVMQRMRLWKEQKRRWFSETIGDSWLCLSAWKLSSYLQETPPAESLNRFLLEVFLFAEYSCFYTVAYDVNPLMLKQVLSARKQEQDETEEAAQQTCFCLFLSGKPDWNFEWVQSD